MSSIKIPSEKVVEGIQKIISNAHRYVKDSKILLNCGGIEHAVVSAVFAAEELAKASALSRQLKEYQSEALIEFPECHHYAKNWLLCHKCKLEEAKNLLGETFIIESCRLGIARLPFRLGVEDKEASHEVRMSCQFVDWNKKEGNWEFGTEYNVYMLELDLLKAIEKNLEIIATRHGISLVG